MQIHAGLGVSGHWFGNVYSRLTGIRKSEEGLIVPGSGSGDLQYFDKRNNTHGKCVGSPD